MSMRSITTIVLSWNAADDLAGCLRALAGQAAGVPQVLVVDNGSADGAPELVRRDFPWATLIENGRNLGFAGGMNAGIRRLQSAPQPPDVVVLLNQDTAVAPDWLEQIAAPFAEDARVGAVGCKIHYPDGVTVQHAGGVIGGGRALPRHIGHGERDDGRFDAPADMAYLTGAALALRMSALDTVGLLDEGYFPAYFEDIDLCLRLTQAGYRLRYQPAATLRHAESRSTSDELRRSLLFNRNRLRFVIKHWPARRIAEEFLLAERAYLAAGPAPIERRVLRLAYLEGILRREDWLAARARQLPLPPEEAAWLRGVFRTLREDLAMADWN